MGRTGPVRDLAALRARVAVVALKGAVSGTVTERARKLLLVWLDAAQGQGLPFPDLVGRLASGAAARQIGQIDLDAQLARPEGPHATAACRSGCAFCCILPGEDGATISEAEARGLHTALAPLAGQPDGRAWHDRACPALDPVSRACRAYAARPMICRTYLSQDAGACDSIARGIPAAGAGVLGAQGVYLVVQSLVRAALEGTARVPTFSLARIAAGAVAGKPVEAALGQARQAPRALEDERKRLGGAV